MTPKQDLKARAESATIRSLICLSIGAFSGFASVLLWPDHIELCLLLVVMAVVFSWAAGNLACEAARLNRRLEKQSGWTRGEWHR